jgi:hypothetical protein
MQSVSARATQSRAVEKDSVPQQTASGISQLGGHRALSAAVSQAQGLASAYRG